VLPGATYPETETVPEAMDKTGVNAFIDALKKVREKMVR
jgi:hypothetical protein